MSQCFIFAALTSCSGRAQGKAHPLYSSTALIYDAVQVLAKALTDLDTLQVTFLSAKVLLLLQDIQLWPLSCESTEVWEDGQLVLGALKEVEHTGLTGEIRLDINGFRTDFQLDLMEKVRGRVQKTGTWSRSSGVNYTMTATEQGSQMVEKLANKTLRVVTTTVGN